MACSYYINRQMSRETTKKIMLIGQTKTGKTSLINYLFKNKQFDSEHYPTVGVEAGMKSIQFENGQFAVIQIWDSAGKHELHEYVCTKFYGDIDGFIIMIDLSDYNTFSSVNYWNEKIKNNKRGAKDYVVGVIANKADVPKHQFDESQFRKLYPNIQFYQQISLKQKQEGNNPTSPELALFKFIRILYDNKLPSLQIKPQSEQKNTNCTCSVM